MEILNREAERQALEAAWSGTAVSEPQLVIVSGKRRVGKTYLLASFASSRPSISFTATRQSQAVELRRFSDAAGMTEAGRSMLRTAGGAFRNWEHALLTAATQARDERLLVVIDEAPYLEETTPGFASIVQAAWDRIVLSGGSHLMLVLTGSAIATMERLTHGDGALAGRVTTHLRLRPVDILAAREFLPTMRPSELIEAYAACGGYPLHLKAWDANASLSANLQRLAYTPGGLLLEDAAQLLGEGLPGRGGYERVLSAIGRGKTRYGEIANEADQRVEYTLSSLERAGFVDKQTPLGARPRTRGEFRIDDTYLAFWFSVLDSVRSTIEAGQGRAAAAHVDQRWRHHVASTFEHLCRAHAIRLCDAGILPSMRIGRWWSTSGRQIELDVVGLGETADLVGEVKWSDHPDVERIHAKLSADGPVATSGRHLIQFALWTRGDIDPPSGMLHFTATDVTEG